jgi:hypothetical protein
MPAQTTNLFLLQDLENSGRTAELADSDLSALRAVADWIRTFVANPHRDLGRTGSVCPFVPEALDRKTLWFAPERVANLSAADVVHVVNRYKQHFLEARPVEGEGRDYKSIVMLFTDLPTDRAKDLFGEVLTQVAVPSYAKDGVVLGPFYKSNEATAIHNRSFRPFTPPVPFLLMRHAVVGDWEFFLDNEDWLSVWARRFGESAVKALAERLRRTDWRSLDHEVGERSIPPRVHTNV